MNSWFGIGPDVTQYRQYSLFGFAFLWWVALWQAHSTPWLISSLLNLHSIHCTIFNSNLLLYWSWAKQGLGPTLCSVCEAFGRALGLSFLSHLRQDKNSFVLRKKKKAECAPNWPSIFRRFEIWARYILVVWPVCWICQSNERMKRFLVLLFYDYQKKKVFCFYMLSSFWCTLGSVEMASLFISDYVLEGSEGTPYAGM